VQCVCCCDHHVWLTDMSCVCTERLEAMRKEAQAAEVAIQ